MSTIVTRAGKGSALTHNEVDANFTNLNTDKLQSGNTAAALTITTATFGAGTVSAPAITTSGDTNTGIFFPAADTIAFTEGGVESMRINSSGNVGIGTSSPDGKLDVNGVLRLSGTPTTPQTGTGALFNASGIGASVSSFQFAVFTGTDNARTERMRITSGGDVTINGGNLTMVGATPMLAATDASSSLRFGTGSGGTERMRIDASGNLGLGVTPSAWSQGRAMELINPGYGVWNGSGSPASIYLLANAYFNSGFKYGGTGQASHYYQYQGEHVWSTAPSGTAGNAITFTQAMTLNASGNLGIGTSSPGEKLDVVGNAKISGDLQFNSGYGSVATAYGCRAWVNFDGTANSNLTGTYARTSPSTTVTVTITAHGLKTGDRVFLDFTTGTGVDGEYVVTVTGVNTFTVTTAASTTTSGNVTLRRNPIRASGNVSSVSDMATGVYAINFSVAMPDANYAVTATMAMNTGVTDAGVVVVDNFAGAMTTGAVQIFIEDVDAGGVDSPSVMVTVHR
jgi:hypothetical protein